MAGDPDFDNHPESPNDFADANEEPFPDLVEDGYERDDGASPGITRLEEFWEERQGLDGRVYYIDHANARYMLKEQ